MNRTSTSTNIQILHSLTYAFAEHMKEIPWYRNVSIIHVSFWSPVKRSEKKYFLIFSGEWKRSNWKKLLDKQWGFILCIWYGVQPRHARSKLNTVWTFYYIFNNNNAVCHLYSYSSVISIYFGITISWRQWDEFMSLFCENRSNNNYKTNNI